mgnify:CR=1 FL=1
MKITKHAALLDMLAGETTPEQLELEFGEKAIELDQYDEAIVQRLIDG